VRRLALALLVACEPDLGDRASLLDETRVLAVRGEPPEARPGEAVRYTVFVASPGGLAETARARWAYCATPKSLLENGVASAACLREGVVPIASPDEAPIPAEACARFGPEVTSAELRPRDPDASGGFFQPVRVDVGGQIAFGLQRIRCSYAAINADVASAFGRDYVPNRNPELLPVTVGDTPPGGRVVIRAAWKETESYLLYDSATRALVTRRETMRVSWYATAGAFASDRTGRAADERDTWTENTWTAPDVPGTSHVFVVLRDDRGGVAFTSVAVTVR